MSAGGWLFWVPVAVLVWVYAGYPVLAAVVGRFWPFRIARRGPSPRLVTIGIAAYNEAAHLEDRVQNVLQQQTDFEIEVVVASDGSTDRTPQILSQLTDDDPRVRSLLLERVGQTQAQAEIFREARGEVVVLSDAETRFAPECLARLIAPFSDPQVGCTTGQLVWVDVEETDTSRNEGFYWRYEQLVRRVESRAGWLTAVTGALLAVRRELYRDVPRHASMDHLLPLYVRDVGLTVLAVADAVATDRPISGLSGQLRNRTRTATRGIRANLSMAWRLAPWRRPSASLAIWSHKLLRWATPILGAAAVAGASVLVAGGDTIYVVPLLGAGLVLVLGLVGAAGASRGWSSRLLSVPLSILVVNLAFALGWANLIRGRRIDTWHGTTWDVLSASSSGSAHSTAVGEIAEPAPHGASDEAG